MPHLLVVGAGPGIGAATARRFARDGWAVSLVARRRAPLAALCAELTAEGRTASASPADAGDAAALTGAIAELTATGGPADAVLFNVSVGREVSGAGLTPEQLLADLAAGVVGLQTTVRAVLPGMRGRGGGTVLVTGGGAADRPIPALPTLGAQKAAVRALALALAGALAGDGVHVATVTVRGLVGDQIHPDRVAAVYADLVAETAGPQQRWRSAVDLGP